MIADKSGQTKESLLRIFDAAVSSKKPTPYKERDKKKDSKDSRDIEQRDTYYDTKNKKNRNKDIEVRNRMILLPVGIEIECITLVFGRIVAERVLLLISNLYLRGLYYKKGKRGTGSYFPLHHKISREIVGNDNYGKVMKYLTKHGFFNKSPEGYLSDVRANEYRLNPEKLDLTRQFRYELTSAKAIALREGMAAKTKTAFVARGEVYRRIARTYESVTFDYTAAISFVASLPESDGKRHRANVVEAMLNGEQVWSVDRQGRNYTPMVGTPRNVRQFYAFGQEPLHVVDIKSSQPLFHALLYPEDSEEKRRYLQLVESGKFWEEMNNLCRNPFDLSDEDEKGLLKETVFAQVFYSFHADAPKKELAVAFQARFPILWQEINRCKGIWFGGNSGLPIEMQRIEADMIKEALLLLPASVPVITIHDSIVTTLEHVPVVTQAIKQAFSESKAGLNPALSQKRLTVA